MRLDLRVRCFLQRPGQLVKPKCKISVLFLQIIYPDQPTRSYGTRYSSGCNNPLTRRTVTHVLEPLDRQRQRHGMSVAPDPHHSRRHGQVHLCHRKTVTTSPIVGADIDWHCPAPIHHQPRPQMKTEKAAV